MQNKMLDTLYDRIAQLSAREMLEVKDFGEYGVDLAITKDEYYKEKGESYEEYKERLASEDTEILITEEEFNSDFMEEWNLVQICAKKDGKLIGETEDVHISELNEILSAIKDGSALGIKDSVVQNEEVDTYENYKNLLLAIKKGLKEPVEKSVEDRVVQTLEYEGKTYATAEEYIKKNGIEGGRLEAVEFSSSRKDINLASYVGTQMIGRESSLLYKAVEEASEHFRKDYKVLLELDENNHAVSGSNLVLNPEKNEVLDIQDLSDEIAKRMGRKVILKNYDLDDNILYKELENFLQTSLQSTQKENMWTVSIIDSGIREEDLKDFFKNFVKENVIDSDTGRLQEPFKKLAECYYFESSPESPEMQAEQAERFARSLAKTKEFMAEADKTFPFLYNEREHKFTHLANESFRSASKEISDELFPILAIEKRDMVLAEYKEKEKKFDKLIEGFEKFIDSKVIDEENERLQPDYQEIGFDEEFIENLKEKILGGEFKPVARAVDRFLTNRHFRERNDIVIEECVNIAIDNKKEDLLHYSGMEKIAQEIESLEYEQLAKDYEGLGNSSYEDSENSSFDNNLD